MTERVMASVEVVEEVKDIVFKSFDGESFKAISNDYLELGHEIK